MPPYVAVLLSPKRVLSSLHSWLSHSAAAVYLKLQLAAHSHTGIRLDAELFTAAEADCCVIIRSTCQVANWGAFHGNNANATMAWTLKCFANLLFLFQL